MLLSTVLSNYMSVMCGMRGSTFIEAYSALENGVSLISKLPESAGVILMFLSVGSQRSIENGQYGPYGDGSISLTVSRSLQTVSLVLNFLAVIVCILLIFLQSHVKPLYTDNPEIISLRSIPVMIIYCAMMTLTAMAYMIVVVGDYRRSVYSAAGLSMVILSFVLGAVWTYFLGPYINGIVNSSGLVSMDSGVIVNNIAGKLTNLLTVPAWVLMLLSVGGRLGKDRNMQPAYMWRTP